MRGELWVDGSFLTEKLNPADVDLLLRVSVVDYAAMSINAQQFFAWFASNSLKQQHNCDNYAYVTDPTRAESEYLNAYWLRQWGFSRGNNMKGIAVMRVPFLVTP